MAEYKSKTVVVNASPMEIFNRAVDLESVKAAVPEGQRNDVVVDGDTIGITYAGFTIAVRIREKVPFSKVVFEDVEAPFHFTVAIAIEPCEIISRARMDITVDADLNFMMKSLLGSRIQEFLDKTVTAISTGELPK